MMRRLLVVLYIYGGLAVADESIRVCYGYGCLVEAEITIDETRWRQVAVVLNSAVDAAGEREMLAQSIGQLYAWSGEQSPIHNDRGGNYADGGVSGAMDCIDHSTSTTRFLKVVELRGFLRWHSVLEPQVRRRVFFEHYSAAIEEKPAALDSEPQRFVVDSWFVDNGKPAVILPLGEWKKGAGPNV